MRGRRDGRHRCAAPVPALLLAVALAMTIPAASGQEGSLGGLGGFPLADCGTLQRPSSPNHWLAASEGPCAAIADEAAPVFEASAEEQAAAWQDWIADQPRAEITGRSADGLQIRAVERSSVFGFTDQVSIAVLPLADGRSSVAIYSRAETGYWDFGVNRARVRDWLRGVGQILSGRPR